MSLVAENSDTLAVVPRPSSRATARARRLVNSWFRQQGWKPFAFQQRAWRAALDGQSGLIHATTGTGKTYAVWFGQILAALARQGNHISPTALNRKTCEPLRILWITPLRALAADTVESLNAPIHDLGIPWLVESRTSDTSHALRSRQHAKLPTALVTTPESLSLMLTRPDARQNFERLQCVVVDEWHELLSSKRGVQTELALARLRHWRPHLQTWGLSATLGNVAEAMQVLLGPAAAKQGIVIPGVRSKRYAIDALIPKTIERFPWAGHLGLNLVGEVVSQIESAATSLVFTNTRSQTEAWYQAILKLKPDWAGRIALHHGSLDRQTRSWVEDGLRTGALKCVVCTSSLDLGVDFSPVERVFQVGSPKGVARLLQRAGRSGHAPGQHSRVTCVPAHAFELIEVAAARQAIASESLERRQPMPNPLDVLTQHAVTVALGQSFFADELFNEVRTTYTYQTLTRREFDWVLDFITTGGNALKAYPDYRRVQRDDSGRYVLDDARIARQHRLSIGTIVADSSLIVQFLRGPRLGTIDEGFLAKIKPGDQFIFAGRRVELVRICDSKVWVRLAKNAGNARIPRWMGGRMPLSTELAAAVRQQLELAAKGEYRGPEMQALRPMLELQRAWSRIPRLGELLIERTESREGYHLYIYPFAGRLVHEGLAALVAFRLARLTPITFGMSVNDYGLELVSRSPPPLEVALHEGLFSPLHVVDDIVACMNEVEMAKRQFREVARIAGLVFPGYANQRKTGRQLQATTGLIYDVFRNYDPENLLLQQAHREVLERQLEHSRLVATLKELQSSTIVLRDVKRFSPLSFPLMVERIRERLSSETLADRVRRMQQALERAAG